MFDGMLKSKFYCKCKSDIKQTRTRVDLVKKKRSAMQKYLRNDIADLLKTGMDIKAYGRAEGLLVEANRSSCYEFVDQCCEHISSTLSAMDKQMECPEECREAVSSLMFAAAHFADMPELRELRALFSERYGNSLGCFINKEFQGKMKSCLPSKESKLRLLQDIAAESGFDWDSKALENKLFNESAYDKNVLKEPKDGKLLKKAHVHNNGEKPEPNKLKNHDHRDDLNPRREAKPIPKSVRRRSWKPEINEETRIQQLNKERAETGRRVLRFLDTDGGEERDEEEKMMDRLLQHYSKKNGPSPAETGKGKSVKPHRTNRQGSLPVVLVDRRPEAVKKHGRSSSLDDDNAHVHPKLPDYDDFVARLAQLRRNRGN